MLFKKIFNNYFKTIDKKKLNFLFIVSIISFFISNCLFVFLANNVMFYLNADYVIHSKEMKQVNFLLKNNISTLIEDNTFKTDKYKFTIKEKKNNIYYIDLLPNNDSYSNKNLNSAEFTYNAVDNSFSNVNSGGYLRESNYPNEITFSFFACFMLIIFDSFLLNFIIFINKSDFNLKKIKYISTYTNSQEYESMTYIAIKFMFVMGSLAGVLSNLLNVKLIYVMNCYTLTYVFLIIFYLRANFAFIKKE